MRSNFWRALPPFPIKADRAQHGRRLRQGRRSTVVIFYGVSMKQQQRKKDRDRNSRSKFQNWSRSCAAAPAPVAARAGVGTWMLVMLTAAFVIAAAVPGPQVPRIAASNGEIVGFDSGPF